MNRFTAITVLSVATILIATGCKPNAPGIGTSTPAAPTSKIIAKFQQAGGGDPATATPQGIQMFLTNHPDVSHSFMVPCLQRQATADSNWIQSPEGRICYFASEVVATRRFYGLDSKTAVNTDNRTFSPVPRAHKTNR